jgi:hypothetical protein
MTHGIQNFAQGKRGPQSIAVGLVVRDNGQPARLVQEKNKFGQSAGIHSANVREPQQ